MDKEKTDSKIAAEPVSNELLELVSGGQSLYDTADDIDKESWFVMLMKKLMSERMGGPNLPLSAQEDSAQRAVLAVKQNN